MGTIRRAFLRTLVFGGALLLVTGCWDRVEIDERGFVIGIAVDKPRSPRAETRSRKEAPNKPTGKNRYAATFQFVIPGKMQSGGEKGSSSAGSESFLNLTSEGDTIFDVDRQISARASRSPYYEHMKVIIISEHVAKQPGEFARIMDFFLREPEMRRSAKVLVSNGEARGALEITPKNERLPVMYINYIAENSPKNSRMLPETKLGDIHEFLLRGRSFAVQRVIGTGEAEVKVVGAAIFRGKDTRLMGSLGSDETEGLNLLTGDFHSGIVKSQLGGELVVFEALSAKRHVKADVTDPRHIRFAISIEMEGTLGETFQQLDFEKENAMMRVEQAVAVEVERMEREAIHKLQNVFKTDAMRLGAYLEQKHNKVWKQIKDDWEEGDRLFTTCEVKLETSVKIRRLGTVNRSHK
ncbi:Ger(x)C family spore germination protein [Paenibacillus allorhizosphaerae]|uniref:Spore germination protein B3 n=1 Tax=Paenibacillus allorhizosphaerae TaxID=2849866 RepID=A0ABM8VK16_9BACL|nr:Ger(x)C family spore germination protein [Paenibacillus allorhizosphaerae]CAG7646375.1 Spore germination protein B3 [Paenibacillus allorhizosphaerae]